MHMPLGPRDIFNAPLKGIRRAVGDARRHPGGRWAGVTPQPHTQARCPVRLNAGRTPATLHEEEVG